MAHFGSKQPAWNRTPAGAQLNPQIFGAAAAGQLGLNVQNPAAAALGQLGGLAGLGGAGVVNALAFNQAGLGSAPAVSAAGLAAARQNQQTAMVAAALQQQQKSQQRAFVGVVTKMQDNYGFVDDEVFFQTNAVRGSMPRVGERVMVEANYNSNMPFKWNAFRVQLLPAQANESAIPAASTRNSTGLDAGGMGRSRESERWGPPVNKAPIPAPGTIPSSQQLSHRYGGGGYDDVRDHVARRSPPRDIRDRRSRSPPFYDDRARGISSRGRSPPSIRARSPPPRRLSPVPYREPRIRSRSRSRSRDRRVASSIHSGSESYRHDRRDRSPKRERGGRSRSPSQKRKSPHRDRDRDSDRSPPRKMRSTPKYSIITPKQPLQMDDASMENISRRYGKLYVPGDFVGAKFHWPGTFPLNSPIKLDYPTHYHIMHKDVDYLNEGQKSANLEPSDSDYRFSAKVILLSTPSASELYRKTLCLNEDNTISENSDPVPANKMVNFLVGLRGKNEVMAIGGPWSPSLDGQDPSENPEVLIKTAIRCCLSLTGIDLSACTQWYKFMEFRYRRLEHDRIETVVLFLPNVHSCVPTPAEFETLQTEIKAQMEQKIADLDKPEPEPAKPTESEDPDVIVLETPKQPVPLPESDKQQEQDADKPSEPAKDAEGPAQEEEKVQEEKTATATHWSKLDLKSMKVVELKAELEVRGLEVKGLKADLSARLEEAIDKEKTQEESAVQNEDEKMDVQSQDQEKQKDSTDEKPESMETETKEDKQPAEVLKEESKQEDTVIETEKEPKPEETPAKKEEKSPQKEEKVLDEKEKQRLKEKAQKEKKEKQERKAALQRHYSFSSSAKPGILVFPSKTAKSGKFECKVVSLNSLLNYRQDDSKEHSFEMFFFAETFHELLLRDAAFDIYKALLYTPDRETEKKMKEKAQKEKEASAVEEAKSEEEKKEGGEESSMEVDKKEDTNDDSVKESPKEEDKKKEEKAEEAKEKEAKKEKDKDRKRKRSRSRSRERGDKEDKNLISVVVNPQLLFSYSQFDTEQCGYIVDRDLEKILAYVGLNLSRTQIQKLIKPHLSKDSLNYRRMTNSEINKETKEPKSEPISLPIASDAELIAANIVSPANKQEIGESTPNAESKTVMFNGCLIDLPSTMSQLKKLADEGIRLDEKNQAAEKSLKSVKEARDSLDKKRRKLEEELEKCKKKYHDAEKCLRNSQDDTVLLKSSLQDCKKLSEKIAAVVDKALPIKKEKPPKKEEPKAPPSEEKSEKPTEPEETKEETEKQEEPPTIVEESAPPKVEEDQKPEEKGENE